MLPKAHLTSHSRMSGFRWVITALWLSGPWRSFLYSSFVYCCYLFLMSSASVRSPQFLPFIVPIFAWSIPLVSLIFMKRSLVFHILLFSSFFALITEDSFLISPCYSLELCIQMGISFLFSFAFIIGDWNAKVGSQEIPGVTGKFGLGVQIEAGQRLTDFCKEIAPIIANTLFQQHKRRLLMDITRWSTPKSDWLYSLQPKMEKLYTGSENKTKSLLWLRS